MADELITDFFGAPIGRIRTDDVTGAAEVSTFHGEPLGTADAQGTRDFLGRQISKQNVPGLLFSKEHNRMLKEKEEEKQKEEAARKKEEEERAEWRREQEAAAQKRREEDDRLRSVEEHIPTDAEYDQQQKERWAVQDEAHRVNEDRVREIISGYLSTKSGLKIFRSVPRDRIEAFIREKGRMPFPGEKVSCWTWTGD